MSSPYLGVLVVLAAVWAALGGYALLSRALYEVRHLGFTGARQFQHLAHAGSLPRRTLAGIASDAHTDRHQAKIAARTLLERRWTKLLHRATSHRGETEKWTRIATLRIFSVADWHVTRALLTRSLAEPDPDVVAATISLLGERGEAWATRLLVQALIDGAHSRSRIAMHLEGREELESLILPLVDHEEEQVRYWAATLLVPLTPEAELALAGLAGDSSAGVRAAVAKAFAGAGGTGAAAAATALLTDPVWFVRAQAARALAASGQRELAGLLTPLLRDEVWWTRAAAKDGLVQLGADAIPDLLVALEDDDRFARNGAAEVLFRLDVLDEWSATPAKQHLVEAVVRAGELPVRRAVTAQLTAA